MTSNPLANVNRNSTPEVGSSSLRPPSARTAGASHALRASADMAAYSTPLPNRGGRPASEVYLNHAHNGNAEEMNKMASEWISEIDAYEGVLEEMATATLDQDFKDELSAIEQWFKVLSEPERTAALYALLQQTTNIQQRFFLQTLSQMSKSHPLSGMLSPANFGEKDPMSQKLSDAMGKLDVGGNRNSMGRPPPSPGFNKRSSVLDPDTIQAMFPDAAAAIARSKNEFAQITGMPPASNRNSTATAGDRSSLHAPSIQTPDEARKGQPPSSPWRARSEAPQSATRPKSASGQAPMGQFTQPPPSAGLRSPRPLALQNDSNTQNTQIPAPDINVGSMPMLSPYSATGGGNWASMVNTPMVGNFQQQGGGQADMVANATAMKLAALSTVNNRINLDDAKKYRRSRSNESQQPGQNGMLMTNELGNVLTPQQAAALQAQQLAALQGQRSRPNSPGFAMQGGIGGGLPSASFISPQNNGFLSAYDGGNMAQQQMQGLNMGSIGQMGQFGLQVPGHEGYLSDHSEINRGRSPRGRRGSSKPPENPTDPGLLADIPAWLRSLRLHKYTDNLKDLKWQDLIHLDDAALEARGVNALGARRKMLKVFDQVRDAQTTGKV